MVAAAVVVVPVGQVYLGCTSRCYCCSYSIITAVVRSILVVVVVVVCVVVIK